jgi:sporulation protein YlmC with PRC-barrel domain
MVKLVIARQLAGRKIITNEGEEVGRLVDIEINEKNGRLEALIIDPSPDSELAKKLKKNDGYIYISYPAVLAASDYIIVDRKNL